MSPDDRARPLDDRTALSRRDALKVGAALLAATTLGREGTAATIDRGRTDENSFPARALNSAQREGVAGRTADLGNGFYLNPILAGDYSDPAVLKDGKDYYMSHSMCGDLSPSILIWHSRDLVNWEPICRALQKGCSVPEIARIGDRYFIYYISNEGGACEVISAPSMSGPWSEPVSLGYNSQIDPGYIRDHETGKHFLYFSQGWVLELAADGLRTVGEPRKVYEGWTYPATWATEGFCLEAPKLFYRQGYYYLCCAEGGTAGPPTSHMLIAARSKSPLGPWENSPHNPIVHTYSIEDRWWSRGHGPVVEGPDGNWWVVYHAYENGFRPLGRQTLLQPLVWTEDGWFKVLPGNQPDRPARKPAGGEIVPGRLELSDDFRGRDLGLQWAAIGERNLDKYRLTGEGLELTATHNASSNLADDSGADSPFRRSVLPDGISLLAAIPVTHHYEAQVRVKCQPGVEAGLLLYYCPQALSGIGLGTDRKIYTMGSIYRRSEPLSKPGDELYLRLVNRHFVITLFWSHDGKLWQQSQYGYEISGYHHNDFDGYAAVRVALYATGEGSALFTDFRHRGLEG